MLTEFPGVPTEIGNYIEFPDDYELLRQPILDFAPAEWVWQHGSEFLKYLLDQAPLRHNTRYVLISSVVRFVYPGILVNKVEIPQTGAQRNEWHVDVLRGEGKVHAICNTLGTEFAKEKLSIEVPDDAGYFWFPEYSERNKLILTPEDSPTNRFVTFDRHIHRAKLPTKKEIRYFVRINEMNHMMTTNGQYQRNTSWVFNGNASIRNIIQYNDGTVSVPVHCPTK